MRGEVSISVCVRKITRYVCPRELDAFDNKSCLMVLSSSLGLWRGIISVLIASWYSQWGWDQASVPAILVTRSSGAIAVICWLRSSKTRATLLKSSCDVIDRKRLLWKGFLITFETDTFSSGGLVANYICTIKFFSRPGTIIAPFTVIDYLSFTGTMIMRYGLIGF